MTICLARTINREIKDTEPFRINEPIMYFERYVNDYTYRINMHKYLEMPYIKTSASRTVGEPQSVDERIIGVHIKPNYNKFYSSHLETNGDIFNFDIIEMNQPLFTLRDRDIQDRHPDTAEHKRWFSIKPKRPYFYRVEVHINPNNNDFHLYSKEVKEISKDGFP